MTVQRLLVADDSLTIQKVIRLALSHDEYEIQTVSDGNDAIQQISIFHPSLVLIDVSLPGKTAFEVKKNINAHEDLQDVRFILMSSAFEKIDEVQAQEVEFHGRLTKPFDPTQLRNVLSQALASAPPLRQTESKQVQKQDPPLILEEPWEREDPFPDLAPPPMPPGMPSGMSTISQMTDTEIKNLTEATLQMSDSDDFQWTIDEKPNRFLGPSLLQNEPTLQPAADLSDIDGVTMEINQPKPPPAPRHAPEPESIAVEPAVLSLTTAQMEDLLKKQLQDTLENMAKKILPEIAERVIKAEIHRLLEERNNP